MQKFGGTIAIPRQVTGLKRRGNCFTINFHDGEELCCKSVVIATGAHYRRLAVPELESFEGKGVYYWATAMEAQTCANEEVVLIGGGNSAGQGAMFLSRVARKVHLMIRGSNLEKSMSRYLINRIPGDFAVGDVRSDSTKRVASAVGEGAMSISFVHQYLSGG